MSTHQQDAEWVTRFQAGDTAAFAELMRNHVAWVLSLCRQRRSGDAEDACQEIFLCAFQDLNQLRQPSTFKAWLKTLAIRICASKDNIALLTDNETLATTDPWDDINHNLALEQAFGILPIPHQKVARLIILYGYSTKDVARLLNIPEGTAKSRLHYARKRLQKQFEKEGVKRMDTAAHRVIAEVEKRMLEFEEQVIQRSIKDPKPLEANAKRWHDLRQRDAESNAKLYGVIAPDVGPRMTVEKLHSGTLSRKDITLEHWGFSKGTRVNIGGDIRDLSRRLFVSPFTILKWIRAGMPALRYFPWIRFDWQLVAKWLAENHVEFEREVTIKEVDNITRYILQAIKDGYGTIEDGMEILDSM